MPRVAELSVLFLSGEQNESDGSRIYRCEYQARQIEQAGGQARTAYIGHVTAAELDGAAVVVLSRCRWEAATLRIVRAARRMNKVLCGDLDDRIYAPWDAHETGAFRTKELFNRHLRVRERAVRAQHDILRLLPCFDEVLASTSAICEELNELGIPSSVARNAIDTQARPTRSNERERLRRILFMTGTRTHDADFQVVRPGLRRFLHEHREIQLTLLGPLAPPAELLAMPQVRALARVPLAQLDALVGEHDVCLVPLEQTRFNDCKSPLKFMECGLVSVPVIASPRREFVAAIRDGQNGMLAEGPDGWYTALSALQEEPALLRRMAAAAQASVLAEYSVSSRGTWLAEHFEALLRHRTRAARPVPAELVS
jgi:glycosyltransferase involved in cell wall biosynthesis